MQRGSPKNRLLDYWIGRPLLNLFASVHRRSSPPVVVKRIGLLCSTALGDTLLFSAAIQDLRVAFPSAHITQLYTRHNTAAVDIIPGIDERVKIELTQPLASIRIIRALNFDVLLDFTSWQRLTAMFTLFSGAKYTVGFSSPGQSRSRGYDCTIAHRSDCHELENYRALLHGSGLHPESAPTGLIVTGRTPTVTLSTSTATPFSHEPDIIALHLWASGQRSWMREWPEERWIELARRLATPETLFVITGAPNDQVRMAPFIEHMCAAGLRSVAFVSPDGLRTLSRVLQQARLVVSVNTGVMHLAAIIGARVISINGPNRNGRWGPVGPWAVGVEAPGEGCGYLHLGFEFDGHTTDCMERISVDQVYAAASDLLAAARESAPTPQTATPALNAPTRAFQTVS